MAACLIIGPSAQATVISYAFSSHASVVLDGTTNTITGSFEFNTSTHTATDVSVLITGADYIDNIPGTYTAASETIGHNGELFAYSAAQYEFGGPLETVEFVLDPSPSISGGSPLAIEDVLWDYAASGYYNQTGTDIRGDVMYGAPEPSGIAILVVGFSGILFGRRVGAGRLWTHSSQLKTVPSDLMHAVRAILSQNHAGHCSTDRLGGTEPEPFPCLG